MSATRVVVTGLGTTSPVGGDVASTWSALLEGRSGVNQLTHEWAEQLNTRIAAEVAVEPLEVLDRVKARRLDRSGQFALIAALEAWADAGLSDGVAAARRPGTPGRGDGLRHRRGDHLLSNYDALIEKGPRRVSPLAIPMLMPNSPAANVGLAIGAKAGVHTPVSACASGNEAIALGIDMIRLGRADVVVCGGTEAAVHALPMAAFGNMMALSKRNDDPAAASRPWDKGRDGFVLGEGAAAIVIESEEHAKARGARIYAEAAGAGITADSHDIAQPDPAGLGATRAMHRAREADLSRPTSSTSTRTRRPRRRATWPRPAPSGAPSAMRRRHVVTSTKSMTGHLLGAAGALESVATILAIRDRVGAAHHQPRRPGGRRPRHRDQGARPARRVTSPRSTTPSGSAATTSRWSSGATSRSVTRSRVTALDLCDARHSNRRRLARRGAAPRPRPRDAGLRQAAEPGVEAGTGTTAMPDQVLRRGCHSYAYTYSLAPGSDDWILETFLLDPRRERIAANVYTSDTEPKSGGGIFSICRNVTRFGTFKIRAKLTTYSGYD